MLGKHAMGEPDTTQQPVKRSKRSTQQGGITMNSSADATKDGYGDGIYEIQTFNPWNVHRTYQHCIKQTRYLDWNFTDDQHPIVIPYHSIAFWMGHYDKVDDNNKTLDIAKKLHDISIAVDYLYGTVKVEVFAVTGNRLIQTGQTSGYTYDFETSQNLIMGTCDKDSYMFSYKDAKDVGLNTHATNIDLWPDKTDTISKIEIPQKEAYTHTVKFSNLSHGYHWTTQKDLYDPAKSFKLCIPSHNNVNKLNGCEATHSSEIMRDQTTTDYEGKPLLLEKCTLASRCNYPAIFFGQPRVNDETGIMKFRYNVRVTTEFHLNYHITPDFVNGQHINALYRQMFNLTELSNNTVANGYHYIYFPYSI